MRLTVKTDTNGKVYTEVIDSTSGYEYVLHRVESKNGRIYFY